MYTYNRISTIKENLIEMSRQIEKNSRNATKELLNTTRALMGHIHEYDKVLNEIGRNGTCKDKELNDAFAKTENFINSINQEITIMQKQGKWTI